MHKYLAILSLAILLGCSSTGSEGALKAYCQETEEVTKDLITETLNEQENLSDDLLNTVDTFTELREEVC